jgi:hypothetical protein
MVASGRGKGGMDLRIGQSTGECGVAPVPDHPGEIAAVLVHDKLDQRAGVEIGDRHGSAALLDDEVRDRSLDGNPTSVSRDRSPFGVRARDDTLLGEPFKARCGVQADQSSDGCSSLRHDDLLSSLGSVDPVAQVCSEGAHGYVHISSVHLPM